LAYILMNNWLNNYAYRIRISFFPFIISLIVLIIITTLLIVAQTTKAAMTNPVKSLKNE
jgi:putative ABC transport system permease protein